MPNTHSRPAPAEKAVSQQSTAVLILSPRPVLDVPGYEPCPECGSPLTDMGAHGVGCERCAEEEETCPACDGSGFVTVAQDSGTWTVTPSCSSDPRAVPCDHRSGLEAWR
jgi:hypothetical protein